MKYTYLILFVFVFISCKQAAKKEVVATVDPKTLISCDGIGEVKLTDSYEALVKKFGKEALSEHENTVAGKFTSLWENQPKQINIYWNEPEQPFKTIKYIEAVDAMSPYMTADSIGVGMSLRDLVRKNGNMAITFTNFLADRNPGQIRDFTNGDINNTNPCLEGAFQDNGQKPIDVEEYTKFQAQEEVKSFQSILNRIDVTLGVIRISSKK